jgi:hypothetical protein
VKRFTTPLTYVVVVAGFIAVPTAGSAQPPSPAQASAAPSAEQTPQQHLDQARKIADAIPESAVEGDAARLLIDLKRRVTELGTSYASASNRATDAAKGAPAAPSGVEGRPPGTSGTTGTSIPEPGTAKTSDWRSVYTMIESDLTSLIGQGSNVPSGTTTATTAPVSGGVPNLNAAVRGHLQEVRSHLQMFYAGTLGQREKSSDGR